MRIVIRPYRESDRQALRDLTVEAFEGVSIDNNIDRLLGPVAGRDWRWRKARHVDEDIDAPGGELAVAEDADSGRPLGYVTLLFDRQTLIGWVHNLAVDGSLRNKGLGRRLLLHALERFRAEGMTVAKIETLEQNPVGRHLYPALGFREVARQIHYAMDLTQGEG
jgi:ribosomal protein S18 acetylase RimI-like enzyme